MVSPGKIENRLGRLLQEFSPSTFTDYNSKMEKIISTYEDDIHRYPFIDVSRDPLVTETTNTSFTIDFASPVYVTMSSPISKFRKLIAKSSSKFVWQVSLIPVYFASINNMSMLKLYQNRAASLFDPASEFFNEKTCIKLSHKDGPEKRNPVKYSSMNIIQQLRAKDENSSDQLSDIFQKYFEFGYWNPPGRGFTPGTYLHDDPSKWKALFKIAKSIYLVEKIGKRENIPILDFNVDVTETEVRPVHPSGCEFQSNTIRAKIESSVIEKISGNANIINGIMTEVKLRDGDSIQIMNEAFVYGPTRKNITKLAMGIMSENIFSELPLIDMQTFEGTVESLLDLWQTYIKTDDEGKEKFAEILEDMFPVIISDGSDVCFVHPLVWGFMERWNMLGPSSLSQREILLKLMHLIHKYTSTPFASRRHIMRDPEMMALKQIVPKHEGDKLPSSIIRLTKEIEFCKMMKHTQLLGRDQLGQNSI